MCRAEIMHRFATFDKTKVHKYSNGGSLAAVYMKKTERAATPC